MERQIWQKINYLKYYVVGKVLENLHHGRLNISAKSVTQTLIYSTHCITKSNKKSTLL